MFCEDKKCPVYIECMERLEALPYCAYKSAELATTANQQLKAEIAALANQLELIPGTGFMVGKRVDVLAKMRQLSAV